jgi:hypothetical protein
MVVPHAAARRVNGPKSGDVIGICCVIRLCRCMPGRRGGTPGAVFNRHSLLATCRVMARQALVSGCADVSRQLLSLAQATAAVWHSDDLGRGMPFDQTNVAHQPPTRPEGPPRTLQHHLSVWHHRHAHGIVHGMRWAHIHRIG